MAKIKWSSFDVFYPIIDKYMPDSGEGNTMASQIVTAVNKLIYKWYNDGDVFDNTYNLSGWANDLSTYANWLYVNLDNEVGQILERITDCVEDDYPQLLYDLAVYTIDEDYLEDYAKVKKVGSIYEATGPFEFKDWYDDEGEEDD